MTSQSLTDRIRQCNNLPSLPTVAMEVLQMANSDEMDLREIADLISNDVALSGKVLKTVNSSFYGLPQKVGTISNALVILGVDAVKTLVLGFSLVRGIQEKGLQGETQMNYWRRSIYSAVTSSLLGQWLSLPECEEIFLAALLQDIGIQALIQVAGEPYFRMLSEHSNWGGPLKQAERAAFGMTHCDAGLLLAEQWHLPPILTETIRWHHSPRRAGQVYRKFCRIVQMSSHTAEIFMGNSRVSRVHRVQQLAHQAFGMDRAACDELLRQVGTHTHETAELLEVNIGDKISYEEILGRANETLQTLTFQSQMRARELKTKSETDPLSGLANRGKLMEELEAEFGRAGKFMRPLSVLFFDADHFKQINDTRGHIAGDEAIQFLAEQIRSFARPMDTVGRYGGEEFVVVLPEMSLRAAAKLAEAIRARIQSTPPTLSGQVWPLTVSVGVATYEGAGGPYRMASHLIQAADKAAYAAKQAGRNTVRIFAPKPRLPAAT